MSAFQTAPRNRIPEEVGVELPLNAYLIDYVFDDLLNPPLRAVATLPRPEEPSRFAVTDVQPKFASKVRKNRYVRGLVAFRLTETDFQVPESNIFDAKLNEYARTAPCVNQRPHH